jgi:hypothetical protein
MFKLLLVALLSINAATINANDDLSGEYAQIGSLIKDLQQNDSNREERAIKKINRKFERDFKRTQKRINKILEKHSDKSLVRIFQSKQVRAGRVISTFDDFNSCMDDQGNTSADEIRENLMIMTTSEFKNDMKIQLEIEIAKAGSAINYLKKVRRNLRINWCLALKITTGVLIVPAFATTMGGMLVFIPVFYAPIFFPALGATVGGFAVAAYSMQTMDTLNCKMVKR